MTLPKQACSSVFASILIATVSGAPTQQAQATPAARGASTNGLRAGIAAINPGPQSPTAAAFRIELQNTGPSDFVLNLGYMLANGKFMIPSAVRLLLTDAAGTRRELHFIDRQHAAIGGRMDDYIVALRNGAAYSMDVSLATYISPATKEHTLTLPAGRYRIAARFSGQGAATSNLDMRGVPLLNFWKGSVDSGVLDFEVAGGADDQRRR
jgi:hypothetical protein